MRAYLLMLFCLASVAWASAGDETEVAKQALLTKLHRNCGAGCKDRIRRFEEEWEMQPPPIESRTEEGRVVTWAHHPPTGFEYEVSVLVSPRGESTVRKAWIRFGSK